MRLITSGQAVDFLAQAAPRPWVKRMLLWMMLDEQLHAYFRRGLIQPYSIAGQFTIGLNSADENESLDDLIRANFEPDFAAKLIGKSVSDRVDDEPLTWDASEEPHNISAGFFLMAEDRNWELGTIQGTVISGHDLPEDWLFWDADEHLGSEFERPDFDFVLGDLCFEYATIELLLPNYTLPETELPLRAGSGKRTIGRPPKWDWESALEHLIAKAQTPDGLPQGAGAQAEIERMMSDWFVATENACPSESQIRSRAQRIMRTLKNDEPTF